MQQAITPPRVHVQSAAGSPRHTGTCPAPRCSHCSSCSRLSYPGTPPRSQGGSPPRSRTHPRSRTRPRIPRRGRRRRANSRRTRRTCFNVKRFRGRLVFKAHRLLYHSTLGWRVMKNKKKEAYLFRRKFIVRNDAKLIARKVFIKSFCKSQFPHKFVNLSFTISNTG